MNIAFFSSSPLSLPLLEKLHQDFDVKLVLTNPDRLLGRKQELTPSPLKTWAIRNQILHITPISLKSPIAEEVGNQLKTLAIDLAIVIDYGLLIPKAVFQSPRFQTINVHFSLLPKYRGANPDSFVILNGEKTTGISFVLIDEGFDTGDILAQKEVSILENETAGQLHQRLYQETEKIISYIINSWDKSKLNTSSIPYNTFNHSLRLYLPPLKQNNKLATYTKRLSREDGFISWEILKKILADQKIKIDELPDLIKKCNLVIARTLHCTVQGDEAISKTERMGLPRTKKFCEFFSARNDIYVHNFYRALSPWPGLWTLFRPALRGFEEQAKRLKILKAHLEKERFAIDEVQLEGKNPVGWKEFCQGYQIK